MNTLGDKHETKILELHALLQNLMKYEPSLANGSIKIDTRLEETLEISVPTVVKYAYISAIPFKDLPLDDWNYNISWRYDDDGFTNAAFALPYIVVDDVSDYFLKIMKSA